MEDMENREDYKDPYKVPEGYFDELYTNILQRKSEGKRERTTFFRLEPVRILSMILVISLVTFGVVRYTSSNNQTEECVTLACVEETELLNEASLLDDEDLIDYISVSSVDTTNTSDPNLEGIDENELLNEL